MWTAARGLFQGQIEFLVVARGEIVAHDNSRACIPAEQGVVVAGGTNGFGLLIEGHRFTEQFIGVGVGAGDVLVELGFGAAFRNDAGIISPIVLVAQAGQNFLRAADTDSITAFETIC